MLFYKALLYVSAIVIITSGCASKGQKNLAQNLGKITINISSEVLGYKKQKSVLTHWCKLEYSAELDSKLDFGEDLESKAEVIQNVDSNVALESKIASKIDSTLSGLESQGVNDALDTALAQDFSSQDSLQDMNTLQDLPQQSRTTTSSKCVYIGGANAFNRAMKTSRFRAPRDEVIELESGVYYLDSFEIEGKKHILLSCDKGVGKCGGWDYAKNKPRFLAFSVNGGENLILPKIKIRLAPSKNDRNANISKQSKQEMAFDEMVFVIVEDNVEDFASYGDKNLSHKAESKRGNAIFSLGFGARFEFATSNNETHQISKDEIKQ